MVGHNWTEKERALLKLNIYKKEYSDLMKMLNLSEDQIKRECRRLGLKKEGGRKCTWPGWAKKFLLENYRIMGDKEISETLTEKDLTGKKWTLKMVERKRTHLGIARTKQELSAIKRRNADKGAWRTEKLVKMRARKAHPQGKVVIWHHSDWPRLSVKHGDKMVGLIRLKWEQANGAIPKKHRIICKTNDRLNADLSNWELLSLEESAKRVHERIKLISPEFYQAWVALKTLKQVITKNK